MAEWRARGYVPDSDEEDESQGSEKHNTIATEEGFQDVNEYNERSEHQQQQRTSLNGDKARKDLGGGKEKEEDDESLTQKHAAETEYATVVKPTNEQNYNVWPNTKDRRLVSDHDVFRDAEDIDELQQDHYQDGPAAQLGTELNPIKDLPNDESDCRTASQPVNGFLRSLSSSPLTEPLQSSPRALPAEAPWISLQRGQGNPIDVQSPRGSRNQALSRTLDQYLNLASQLDNDTLQQNRARRNLRHRNPIQLHPYAIESEKYRQILKAGGVKPLRIAQMEAELANSTRQDTQEQDFNADEESQPLDQNIDSQDLFTSTPPADRTGNVLHAQGLSDIFQFEGDELPDMDSLLHRPSLHVVTQGNKRRKTTHTFSKKEKRRAVQPEVTLPTPLRRHLADDDKMFDVPPSPPESGSPTPTGNTKHPQDVFRVPRELPSVALPTPVTSSEPRRHRPVVLFDDSETDDDPRVVSTSKDFNEDSEPGSSSSENEENSQLKRVRRKIKGVLPASWLKIDLKANTKIPEDAARTYTSPSPVIGEQRGVARPISGLSGKSPDALAAQQFLIDLSDDEDSGLETSWPISAITSEQHTPSFDMRHDLDDHQFSTANFGEVDEDNRVDAMLPLAKRSVIRPKQAKIKDHTKLKKAVPRPSRTANNESSEKPQSRPSYQPRITDRFDKRRRKNAKFRTLSLGILDALERDQFTQATPQFLKVARRTARSRHDQGRHSPSKKFLRLATADDTNDANETLQCWREGTLSRAISMPEKRHMKLLNRQPLYPRSHNPQLPQMPLGHQDDGKEALRFSCKVRPVGYLASPKKPRMLQRSLDNIFGRGASPQIQQRHDRQRVKCSKVKLNVKKPGVLSSIQKSYHSRPALLESLQAEEDRVHPVSVFKRDLARIEQTQNQADAPNIMLARFFDRKARPFAEAVGKGPSLGEIQELSRKAANDRLKPPLRRKKNCKPRRINVEAFNSRQTSVSSLVEDDAELQVSVAADEPQQQVLIGLGPFGTHYTDNFDVKPLPKGTCFHQSTFIGSGEFLKSLNMARTSDLDRPRGFMPLSFAHSTFRWGPWDEEVSGQLVRVSNAMCQELRLGSNQDKEVSSIASYEQMIQLQRNLIRYLSDHLSFLDLIDRNSHLQIWKDMVLMVFHEINACIPADRPSNSSTIDERTDECRIRLSTLLLVIANQLCQVSKHDLVPYALRDEVNSLVLIAARWNLTQVLKGGLQNFRKWLENLKPLETTAYSIRKDHHAIESLVVTQHIIKENTGSIAAFWEIVNQQMLIQRPGKAIDVRVFEDQWQKLYTLLPFLEFDAQGILESGRHFRDSHDDWIPIKRMISQVLEVYMSDARAQPPSLNAYCRVLFSRCLNLINSWGWQRCESIIGTLFDFFARSNLAHLRNEESHGSALFLEHLDQRFPLEISATDRCFHILLKIIGSGLKCMREIYPEKKIRDVVWRLMPNHGRSHPKEEAVRREDLDALRNHHDLLCTLYWAAPPAFRPRVSVIRNLVHLESSHREACHISIRAWSNLVRFQLSTDEPVSSLDPFADWHDDLMGQILRQHSLARTEAEEQVKSAHRSGGLSISKYLLESAIARNQRQVEAILDDALTSFKRAINEARTLEAAGVLLTSSLTQVFVLFDARRPQINQSIVETLDILLAYVGHYSESSKTQDNARNLNDDSQEYGDWSGFNDDSQLSDNDMPSPLHQMSTRLQESFHEPLRHLLSNCFGADTVPNDDLLSKLVEVWVAIARCLVHHGTKPWSDYVGRYGHDSWTSLRDTEQTRKFTAYFLAVLIEIDSKVYEENKSLFVTSWIKCLVERESMLKFQHRLTSALLNTDPSNPLLKNLPFYANKHTDLFEITATEFSQRRQSLISSLLSNMRESIDDALYTSSIDAAKLRQDYKEILKQLMLAMKQRYQELGDGPELRGTYVDFVHRVIEFLQQHTSTICPVDRFFMDSAAFPLPATDPTYVVGQLKNYGLRLQDSRTPKQLAVFLQSVSERAMVDGQQEYLVGQLHGALANTFEYGDPRKPTLRAFVVNAIVPAYIEVAFSTASGWLLTLPMLQALEKAFCELLTDLDGTNPASMTAVMSTVTIFLDCLRSAFNLLVDHSGLLDQPKVLKTLAVCYSTITATMPVLDYITRLWEESNYAVNCIDFFKSFASFTVELLLDDPDVLSPEVDDLNLVPPDHEYADVRKFTLQELRETLNKDWVCHDEQYHVVRGSSRREVRVDIGSYAEEKDGLLLAIQGFEDCLGAMPALHTDVIEEIEVRKLGGISLDDILLS